jgi:hypothetical protein
MVEIIFMLVMTQQNEINTFQPIGRNSRIIGFSRKATIAVVVDHACIIQRGIGKDPVAIDLKQHTRCVDMYNTNIHDHGKVKVGFPMMGIQQGSYTKDTTANIFSTLLQRVPASNV